MKAQINRKATEMENTTKVTRDVEIYIGKDRYDLRETNEGHLEITKNGYISSAITIFPRVTNQIEIK